LGAESAVTMSACFLARPRCGRGNASDRELRPMHRWRTLLQLARRDGYLEEGRCGFRAGEFFPLILL
jgi:hypothetical protein